MTVDALIVLVVWLALTAALTRLLVRGQRRRDVRSKERT
jgi:hypothetical protein